MSVLKIKIYGEDSLREKAKPVKEISKKIIGLAKDMADTMYHARGVGLAANQVGVLKRIITIDVTGGENGDKNLIVLVNPEITAKEGLIEHDEGCLSLPGINASVKRSAKVTVRGLDIKGNPVEIAASDLLSIAFQHEIDHLDGIMFIDRLSFTQKILLQKKIKELERHKSA